MDDLDEFQLGTGIIVEIVKKRRRHVDESARRKPFRIDAGRQGFVGREEDHARNPTPVFCSALILGLLKLLVGGQLSEIETIGIGPVGPVSSTIFERHMEAGEKMAEFLARPENDHRRRAIGAGLE